MTYKCVTKPLESGAVALTVYRDEKPLSVQEGSVLIDVELCVIDIRQVAQTLPQGQGWSHINRCSLVGHTVQVGQGVDGIRAGDHVIAFGPLASRAVLPVHECLVVPGDVDADQAACWALAIELIYNLRRVYIEIGESVLVLGDGLTGLLTAQLAFAAGAVVTVGVNPEQANPDSTALQAAPGLDLLWLTNEQSMRDALLSSEVDVLIDASGDVELLKDMIPFVRDGGRVSLLTAYNQPSVDFDFYPDVHRRSLKLLSGNIGGLIRQTYPNENMRLKDIEFVRHLFETGRLRLECMMGVRLRPLRNEAGEQTLWTSETPGLLVEW